MNDLKWWEMVPAVLAAAALHAITLTFHLYTHDCWNDVLLGELVLNGGLDWDENINRILVTLSFGPRAIFGPDPLAWHLPNVLVHTVNAALCVALAAHVGAGRAARIFAGLIMATAPLIAHPVEWVGGGYDLFSTLFSLSACLAFLRGGTWSCAVFVALAATSKEVGLIAPGLVVLMAVARDGLGDWVIWKARILKVLPSVVVVLVIFGLRVAQLKLSTSDSFAGRSVEPRPLQFLLSAPAAVGLASSAALTDLMGLLDPRNAIPWGYGSLIAVLVAIVARKAWQLTAVLGAAALALVPVSLIGMDAAQMVENARYLYLSVALASPILPILIMQPQGARPWIALGAVLFGLSTWGGVEQLRRASKTTNAVAPVLEYVTAMEPGSRVWVLSNLYDEPTARFLMSRWLRARRQITAHYVMRGTWITYARRPSEHDAALAYFGPTERPMRPSDVVEGDHVLLQFPANASLSQAVPVPTRAGPWEEVSGAWKAVDPPDPEDMPIWIQDGRTLNVERWLGPVASAEVLPAAELALPARQNALAGVRLTVRVESDARLRYGSGYHERFATLFWGPVGSKRFVSFEVPRSGQTADIELDLSFDPIALQGPADRLGLLPLNYPGRVTVESVHVRFVEALE